MSDCINLVIPNELRQEARELGLNLSAVCRRALREEVSKLKTDAGAVIRQDSAPTADLKEGISNVRSG